MSNRERWTVYPLLFLTLGIVLKDKLIRMVNIDTVVCRTLVVTDRDQHERVVISSNPGGGIVKTESSSHRLNILLGHSEKLAGLIFTDGNNNLLTPTIAVQQPPLVQPAAPEQPQQDTAEPAEIPTQQPDAADPQPPTDQQP